MSHIFSGCLTNHWLFKYSSKVQNQHAMAAVANLERNPSDSLLSIIWRSDLQTHGTLQSIAELLPCGKSKLLPYHTVFLSQLTPKKSPQKRGWTWSSNDFSLKKKLHGSKDHGIIQKQPIWCSKDEQIECPSYHNDTGKMKPKTGPRIQLFLPGGESWRITRQSTNFRGTRFRFRNVQKKHR